MTRGDVVLVRFPHPSGLRGKKRPAVVVQADTYTATLGTVVLAEVTKNPALANDPACLFIDRLGVVLAQIAARADPLVSYSGEDGLRLTAPAQRFEELLQVAAPVLYHSRGDPQVLAGVLDAAERIRRACADDSRRLRALARLGRGVQRALREGDSPAERSARRRAAKLVRELTQRR